MGSDYSPPSVGTQTRDSLKATARYGPAAMRALNQEIQGEAPGQAATDYGLYSQYANPYAQIGEGISDLGAQRGVQRDTNTINNGGAALAGQATALDRAANPEFYGNRETAGRGFQALIGGQDPNKLSGSEMANVERGVNRLNYGAGNSGSLGDATTTASNALQFDDRLQAKRAAFGQSLSLFPGIQQGSRSPVDAYQIASGRGAQANSSLGQYQAPVSFDANASAQGIQQNAFGITGARQQQLTQRRIGADYASDIGSKVSPCCFIFLESYNGKLPQSVRLCRDYFYSRNPLMVRGYRRMASWLVPAMRCSAIARWLVNNCMIRPMTRYGEWLVGNSPRRNPIDKLISKLWFNIWNIYA